MVKVINGSQRILCKTDKVVSKGYIRKKGWWIKDAVKCTEVHVTVRIKMYTLNTHPLKKENSEDTSVRTT